MGEEVTLETAELTALEGKGNRRVQTRKIPASDLTLFAAWLDTEPDVPTLLLPGQVAKGERL